MKVGFAKKLGTVVLAAALAMSMAPAAFAKDIVIKDQNINGKTITTAEGAYEGYEIFKGTIQANPKRFVDPQWGSGVDAGALITALQNDNTPIENSNPAVTFAQAFAGITYSAADPNASAAEVIKVLDKYKGTEEGTPFAINFAKRVSENLKAGAGVKSTYDAATKKHTIPVNVNEPQGAYYFVKDADGQKPLGATSHILVLVDPTSTASNEINPKADVPTVEKEVMDFNDSVAGSTDDNGDSQTGTNHDRVWRKSADHDIQGAVPKDGDRIPHRIYVSLPSNYKYYNTYKLSIHDNMSPGLKFDDEAKKTVKLYKVSTKPNSTRMDYDKDPDAVLIPESNYTLTVRAYEKYPTDPAPLPEYAGGTRIDLAIADTKQLTDANGQPIDVKATDYFVLRYDVVFDEAKAIIGSKGNPNEAWVGYSNNPNDNGDGTTISDKKTTIAFTYKYEVNKVDKDNQPLEGADFTLKKYDAELDQWLPVRFLHITPTTKFEFTGLDDGYYVLEETQAPPNLAKIAPIYFWVVAEHDDSKVPPELVSLKPHADNNGTPGDEITNGLIDVGTIGQADDGVFKSTVVNEAPWLPTTGGMGTFLLYLVGGVLIVGAGVLLFVKKRASKEA